MKHNVCKICKNTISFSTKKYIVKEMMFGMGESFEYIKCDMCGCLQICDVPKNMEKYYPKKQYYSLKKDTNLGYNLSTYAQRLKSYIKYKSYRNIIFNNKNILGIIGTIIKPHLFTSINRFTILRNLPHNGILDVGCGNGSFLIELAEIGFTDLEGVDLFIDNNIVLDKGIKITKGVIHDIKEKKYNLIMLHHSLEHMEDQQEVMNTIDNLLLPNGVCVIRIPVIARAWEIYEVDWFQIDAPRHFYLHTEKSLAILAENSGLYISDIHYDSKETQFVISDLYKKNINLINQTKYIKLKEIGLKKIKDYKKQAEQLNKLNNGDQAIFILKKKESRGKNKHEPTNHRQ